MAAALAAALLLGHLAAAQAQVLATRIWPARDYTRVTFESRQALDYSMFALKNPERLVLDLSTEDAGGLIAELQAKVAPADPYIAVLRVGVNRPGVTRVVLDLKAEVRPQVFALKPVADYGHRLVLDLYPLVPPDPLVALLELNGQLAAPAARRGAEAPARSVVRLATVVIDPGHGGEDPGARGRRGTLEKDVNLLIAKRLKAVIDAEPGMRAVLTRDGDYYLSLQARVEKARAVKADLFVSVHADAFIRPHARGSSVFTLSQRPTSEAARWLAKQENDSDLIGGVSLDTRDPYLKQVLVDLSQTATSDHSLKLAGAVLSELGQINTLHKAHVERAAFAVLKAPDVPSILVETAFISNPQEESRLQDERYQDKMARAMLAGIKRYFSMHPPRPQGPLALK
ncbi:MAG: N-acetylmuramoyl-L-alanine amidase [Betaproteobacteria bacterium]|nr:N-acetylmuramoyl-L-alanine amidase [Betaproteobacteria bacterium]MDH5211059.1 N-acetylmuramoyl-L-alanine amidase [Betaproteobacteria bacterium]